MQPAVQLPGSSGHWKELYQVFSDSRPGVSYIVARHEQGQWGCSCPAWTFHTPRKHCKHITFVLRQLAGAAPLPVKSPAEVQADPRLCKHLSRFALVEV